MKYPEKWLDALSTVWNISGPLNRAAASDIIDKLKAAGAIVNFVEPREWYLCPCGNTVLCDDIMRGGKIRTCTHFGEFPKAGECLIRVREVID